MSENERRRLPKLPPGFRLPTDEEIRQAGEEAEKQMAESAEVSRRAFLHGDKDMAKVVFTI